MNDVVIDEIVHLNDEVDIIYKSVVKGRKKIFKFAEVKNNNPRINGVWIYLDNNKEVSDIPVKKKDFNKDNLLLYYNGSGRTFSLDKIEQSNLGTNKLDNWSIR